MDEAAGHWATLSSGTPPGAVKVVLLYLHCTWVWGWHTDRDEQSPGCLAEAWIRERNVSTR